MTAPLQTIQAQRSSAMSRYSAAAAEYRASYIELAAFDRAIENARVGGGPARTFGGNPPEVCAHSEALPDVATLNRSPGDEIIARMVQILIAAGVS